MRPILFAPHNDDETLFASFLIQRELPIVIVCYRSFLQEREGIEYEVREQETAQALELLTGHDGLYHQWQFRDDAEYDDDTIEAQMWGLLDPMDDEFPHAYVPFEHRRSHPQHNQISRVAKIVFPNVTEYLTYDYDPGNHGPKQIRGEQVIPQPEWIIRKLHALAYYRSQVERGPRRMWLEWDLREYVR